MSERFEKAIKKTLAHEGGYVNDPKDPGGETNFGISKRTYRELDIKNLTREDAEAIYFEEWWQKYDYDAIDDLKIAEKVFDLAVNMGHTIAHCLLQMAVCRSGHQITIDGIIGPETLGAVNGHPVPEFILANLKLKAVHYYLSLKNHKYEKGWVKRAIS